MLFRSSQDFLEGTVFRVVRDYLGRLKEIDVAEELRKMGRQQRAGYMREEKETARQIDKLTEDIHTLEDKIPEAIRGGYCFSAEALARMIQEKGEQLKALRKDRAKLRSQMEQTEITDGDLARLGSLVPDWEEVFEAAGTPEKKMLLASLIERVDVRDDGIRIKFRIRIDDFYGNADEKVRKTNHSPTTPYTPCST